MKLITLNAIVVCDHQTGMIKNVASQHWLTIDGVPVLVATDPEHRSISGCSNTNPTTGQKPCLTTLKVKQGYSEFIAIDGHAACLESVKGLTDGTPPGTFNYSVRTPAQTLVDSDA